MPRGSNLPVPWQGMLREGVAENNTQGGECGTSEEGQDLALEGKSEKKLDSQRQESAPA